MNNPLATGRAGSAAPKPHAEQKSAPPARLEGGTQHRQPARHVAVAVLPARLKALPCADHAFEAASAFSRVLQKMREEAEPFAGMMPANDGLDGDPWRFLFLEGEQGWADGAADNCGTLGSGIPCGEAGGIHHSCEEVADLLLPLGSDSGIFEVEMPGGEKMGVVVEAEPASVCFLLSPLSAALGGHLRQRRGELESRVERRIQKNVRITVL